MGKVFCSILHVHLPDHLRPGRGLDEQAVPLRRSHNTAGLGKNPPGRGHDAGHLRAPVTDHQLQCPLIGHSRYGGPIVLLRTSRFHPP